MATTCDTCGERDATTTLGDGTPACERCKTDARAYGHLHGIDDSTYSDAYMARVNARDLPAVVAMMRAEVLACIRSGQIPQDVRTFSDLHDYVDANEFGGFCDPRCTLDVGEDRDCAFVNDAQDAIHYWLQALRPHVYADTAYRSDAERRRADRAERNTRNR